MCSFGGVLPYTVEGRDERGQQGNTQNRPAQAAVAGKKK